VQIGFLEFRENRFIESVAQRLSDLETGYIRIGELAHPSPAPARVVIDRVSFCDPFLRTVVRYWSLAGAYIINDPFFTPTMDKLSELLLYDELGIHHPRSILLPRINRAEDMRELVAEPDWSAIERVVGFPCILKPVDGYAWQDVFRVETPTALRSIYDSLSDSRTLLVQELVEFADYYRAFCVDRSDVMLVRWTPRPFDQGEYAEADPGALDGIRELVTEQTARLVRAQGLDFNTVEWSITRERRPVIIDSYNDVPDVRPEKLPPRAYQWIVDRFCACVRRKLASAERNNDRAPAAASDPGPGTG
jgi:hypothetical protein